MKYYAAILRMKDVEKSQDYRSRHLQFLEQNEKEGKIFARGRFADGAGGLIIYVAGSGEEARTLSESDPYIISGARALELHEWEMKSSR
jgi:uncharacterized protein YciI